MDQKQIDSLIELPLADLIFLANKTRQEFMGFSLELCTIMNAKSGFCSQDCKFCAQASRHPTGIATYPLKKKIQMIEAARQAKDIGAERFDIVTSGNTLSKEELGIIADAIWEITSKVGIKMCASLGRMDERGFSLLKAAGLSRYHHNIETSPGYFPKIVTTHTFQERIDTIRLAKEVGLEVCSGGIIGMGESLKDRVEMALILKGLDVESVPLNILVPIKNTPLERYPLLSCQEAIMTIALFRIILKDKIIKVAAGRESILKDFQALAFMAGANGMLIGGYLTLKGREVTEDRELVKEIKQLWQQ
ncbi:MAG: biotin synthase BioB [Candidatus Omnitrophica bacterium]|nr:biotin synthase BioB [Candidatus Omnitrophota bacterium]MBI5144819.1 biotin synthase BioB [Candidatus Omnitrophota bacterium]